jgi:formyltetrahydrofolate deformylase
MSTYVLTSSCKSTRGIVAAILQLPGRSGLQHRRQLAVRRPRRTGKFFMRVSFISEEGASADALVKQGFKPVSPRNLRWML